ncbi:hypothetical protein [Corallococcus macrosporus]|uniref:Transposase IS116/IS110/IS902 family protein n=1 Tax=Myxococcus fulvus (strain ATCC BAA-855 / HW-1) TaxID=483219 RepID=F8CNE6_MYXFH|nr:hypothetical protein [Corallococcus macrosporus]AEI62863.1 transposase IS116/IS110/IS902 family protein [Corallococcus macrosporus]
MTVPGAQARAEDTPDGVALGEYAGVQPDPLANLPGEPVHGAFHGHEGLAALLRLAHQPQEPQREVDWPSPCTSAARLREWLIQTALRLLRAKKPETAHLREWAERIAARRGKKTAVVALARRLAGILFAMMRDGTEYRAPKPAELEAAA